MGDPLLLPQGPEWANCLTSQSHQDLSAGIPPLSPAPPTCFLLILTLSSRAWKPHSGLDSLLGIIPNSFPLILTSFLLIIPAWQYPTPVEPRYPLMPHPSSSKQFQRKTTQLFVTQFLLMLSSQRWSLFSFVFVYGLSQAGFTRLGAVEGEPHTQVRAGSQHSPLVPKALDGSP